MNDAELGRRIEQLRRGANDFCGRAAQAAEALKREGREHFSDPLYQCYASIRDFLRKQLAHADRELERRAHVAAPRPITTLGAAAVALALPWRRARAME
jgi:hypothetical protein